MKKVKLLLSGKKGLMVLQHLIQHMQSLQQIHSVEINTDKHVLNDYSAEMDDLCRQYEIRQADNSPADYTIAIGWQELLPATANTIIFHDSLLPAYRGFSPVVNALIQGESKIGATAFFAVEEVDAGPIIMQYELQIQYPITIAEAIDKMGELYMVMAYEIFRKIRDGIPFLPHNQVGTPSYSIWRDVDDYRIDWYNGAAEISRFVDAVGFPYKGAIAMIDSTAVRIHKCEVVSPVHIENHWEQIGKILRIEDGCPVVICGDQLVKITQMTTYVANGASLLPWLKLKTRFK